MPRPWTLVPLILAATALIAGCSSTTAGIGSLAGIADTQEIILKPVNNRRAVTSGYTVNSEYLNGTTIECNGGAAQSAVSAGIASCSPKSANAHTCWASPTFGQALCLMDPFKPVVHLIAVDGYIGGEDPPRVPVPLGIELEDGTQCTLLNGGAGPSHKSGLAAAYSCSTQSTYVWDTISGPMDKSKPEWTVQVGQPEGALQTMLVSKAYFVGTA